MDKKNLPIKLFEKRKKVDERKTEGGGSDILPPWARLDQEQLAERVQQFTATLEQVSKGLEGRNEERDFIPAVIRLELHEMATAKSHRQKVAEIFNTNDQLNIIGYTDERDLLVKINTIEDVQRINNKLSRTEKNKRGIAAITEITKFQPEILVKPETVIVKKGEVKEPLRVSLINFSDYQLNQSVTGLFEKICKKKQITFRKTNYSPELIIYRLSGVTLDALEVISNFEAIETISFMPKYTVVLDDLTSINDSIKIKKPIVGKVYPIVGVLDSGIKDIPHLKPWILDEKFTKVIPDPVHGTFVAGILVYGDELAGKDYVGNDGCFLYDATIHPGTKDYIEEFELLEHIREVIDKKHKEVKVWNLSLGTTEESEHNEFSYFGKSLDQIQERYDVVICKSAGNCRNFLVNKPVSRVSKSADSVRSLVVGSIAQEKGRYDLAEKNHRSPFSRIGKAPAFINKPELTHIGGNAGVNPANGKTMLTGIRSFSDKGQIASNVGTSFSTPRISALLATLESKLQEEPNPLLLKALAIHSAKYPKVLNMPNAEKLKSLGYGIPSNVNDILYNDPYEITLILQDTLVKGNWIEISDFPFPTNMTENGLYYGEIKVTLVSCPVLSESQGAEYCQSNLEVRLGTYDKLKPRSGKTIKNAIGLHEAENLLRDALYPQRLRDNHIGDYARERTLVKYGDKYQPIKKYAVDLEEMTPTNKTNFLTAPKKWYLTVEGLFRDYAIGQSEKNATELSQDFCLIATIRDNKRKHRVYDIATKLLNDNGFVHSNINLRTDVKISVR